MKVFSKNGKLYTGRSLPKLTFLSLYQISPTVPSSGGSSVDMLKGRLLQVLLIASAMEAIKASLSNQSTYCVGDSKFSNCPTGCYNFQDVVGILQSNSIVSFCPGRVTINFSIVLINLSNVTFFGRNHLETTLSCEEDGIGLTFINSSGIAVKNLKLENCGSEHNSTTQSEILGVVRITPLRCAVFIINCSNFKLEDVHISNSDGLGLVLYDTSGVVEVIDSVFYNNSLKQKDGTVGGGGGMYVEFTVCMPGVYCTDFDSKTENTRAVGNLYKIKNCTFHKNSAYFYGPRYVRYTKENKRQDHQGLGRGGGLSIQLNGKSKYNTFIIDNCTFSQNIAKWGGGLYIVVQDSSSHNNIQLKKLTFFWNKSGYQYSGGGVDLGFNIGTISNNSAQFYNCKFVGNKAMLGGGVRIYSSQRTELNMQNIIEFSDCQWIKNVARFGSAIDIAPHEWEVLASGFLPVPLFHNCEFRSNKAHIFYSSVHTTQYTVYKTGRGAMMVTNFKIVFSGLITFVDNDGSAVFLSSGIIHTAPQTTCSFTNNRGFQGGAISLVGFSALFVRENNYFYFYNNTAKRRGGAMYAYTIDKHDFQSSRSCFIQYHGSIDSEGMKNVTFEFVNNSAGYRLGNLSDCYASGYSIFSSTLLQCIHACKYFVSNNTKHKYPAHNQIDPFKCVGNFKFIHGADIKCQVSTSGGRFDVSGLNFQNIFEMYPGRDMKLNISVYNDFNLPINAEYYASLEGQNNSNIKINQAYSYVSNRRMRLYGTAGSTGVLRLQKLGYREIMLDINVQLIDCPPGFELDEFTNNGPIFERCVCSASHSSTSYKPIRDCNDSSFQAHLQKGYWLGYYKERLGYGYCPSGYCANLLNATSILPRHRNELDKTICGEYRMGRLCGQCRSNYSVHYHGINYQCGTNDSCKYGWLLYIISEILPLTLLFVIATVFNISFTSGAINGFIWFAQMVHSIPITGKSFILFPGPVHHLLTITRMIYNFFNFDFFSHDKLSFCLWRGATTMDMLVFKFVTVVYAILLVIITVALINYCSICQRSKCFRFSTVKSSIIHGLSSVLVIVFSQCINICCRTLEIAYISGKGNQFLSTVVFYQGNLTPFSGGHIKYAILAVCCILIMIIPMLLLLIFPLNFKLMKLFRCGDSNPAARCLCNVPYSKLRPFLDSFQSCFKDKYRFFAGLYFVYRALILSTTLLPRLTQKYDTLDSFLVIFLVIHAITHPYREHLHNIIDGLLFFNLLAINKITSFNYSYSSSPTEGVNPLPYTTTATVILLNIPLFCIIVYVIRKIVPKIKAIVLKHSTVDDKKGKEDWNELELPNRDEESDSEDSCEYQPFDHS